MAVVPALFPTAQSENWVTPTRVIDVLAIKLDATQYQPEPEYRHTLS